MAISDQIRMVDWKVTQNTIVNTSLTGDRYVANIGTSHWEFTLKSAPIPRSDTGNKMPLATDNTDIFTFRIPTPLDDSKGTVSGTVTVTSSTSDGASPAGGSRIVATSGGSGTLKSGDFIKFSNHTKVYMLTQDTNLDGSTTNNLVHIYPGVIKDVTGATITYDNVQIKAQPISKAFNYSIGVDDLMEWEQTFREVV